MGKPKYDPPTPSFPYKISKRLNILSIPVTNKELAEIGPAYTPGGVRVSAIHGTCNDRCCDVAWPYLRRLVLLKKMYKKLFSQERLDRIDRMIEMANATPYAKLANATIDLKKLENKDVKKKRGWSESEWKKHMDYISQIAGPKKVFEPPPVVRGESVPLDDLMPRINVLTQMPPSKVYKRLSKETWYRNPEKVSPGALKYVITERTLKLAKPKALPEEA